MISGFKTRTNSFQARESHGYRVGVEGVVAGFGASAFASGVLESDDWVVEGFSLLRSELWLLSPDREESLLTFSNYAMEGKSYEDTPRTFLSRVNKTPIVPTMAIKTTNIRIGSQAAPHRPMCSSQLKFPRA